MIREEKEGRVFIICPEKPVEIGRIEKNREKLEALYQGGYHTAEKEYEKLKEFLGSPEISGGGEQFPCLKQEERTDRRKKGKWELQHSPLLT